MTELTGVDPSRLSSEATRLVEELRRRELHITTVESCTGGGVANAITNIPGASEVLCDAFVTYSNAAKVALGVSAETIDRYTVYSPEVAIAMARAGIARSVAASIAIGVTGTLTRSDPANAGSQVGQVFLGFIIPGQQEQFLTLEATQTDRENAKNDIATDALEFVLNVLPRT